MFNNYIEVAIEKKLKNKVLVMVYGKKGIAFNKPLEIDINSMFNERNHLILGKYELNNIKNKIIDKNVLRKVIQYLSLAST